MSTSENSTDRDARLTAATAQGGYKQGKVEVGKSPTRPTSHTVSASPNAKE